MANALADNPSIRYEKRDGVAWLTLWRPEVMNALNGALREGIADGLQQATDDPEIACIVLTGSGERAFSAGVDLKEMGERGPEVFLVKDPVRAIEACPKPIIAAVNGVAATGGFELVLACDIIIAADSARFADTHARVGLIPSWGLSQRLARAIGTYRAKELSLTGNFLSAATAERWGLVNRVVPAAELIDTAARLAADIASIAPEMTQAYKRVMDEGFAMPFGAALEFERGESARHAEALSPADIEARRLAVLARGRQQGGG